MLFRFVFLLFIISVSWCFNGQAQIITTIAGTGISGYSGDAGPATAAKITIPGSMAFDLQGNLYFRQRLTHRVRVISTDGIILTAAGNGIAGYSGDGANATSAQLNNPVGVGIDKYGNLFIADSYNNRIRKVDRASGIITTVAGNGIAGFGGDGGPATLASLNLPQTVCLDTIGNIYISDYNNQRVRKVIAATGNIVTIAGNGHSGFSSDGGLADTTMLNFPLGLTIDTAMNLFIADHDNNRVRKIDVTSGIITTVAGDGDYLYDGEWLPALSTSINPWDICFDDTGNLLIADHFNSRIRKLTVGGQVYTIIGNGISAFSGDGGEAISASINKPQGVALDECSNIYVGDAQNNRIRKVVVSSFSTPTISATGITSAAIGSTVTVNATVTGTVGSYSIKWFRNSSLFSITTVPAVTYIKGAGTDTITARVVPAASYCSDSATSAPHLVAASGVSVDDVVSDIGLSVFPSPAGAVLHVSAGAVLRHIEITNILGQTVIDTVGSSSIQHLDVSALQQGVYLVRVNDRWVRRFVKE